MTNVPANTNTDEATLKAERRAREAASETRSAAFRAAVIWMPLGPVVCVVLLRVLRGALISAQELATEQAGFPTEPFMPVALFAAAGACFGAFVAWRVINSSGAVGGPVLLVTLICQACTFVAGAIAAPIVFADGVPGFGWLAIVAMTVTGLFTAWLVNKVLG